MWTFVDRLLDFRQGSISFDVLLGTLFRYEQKYLLENYRIW